MKKSIKNNVSILLVIMILLSALYPVGIYADNETAGEQTGTLSSAAAETLIKVVQYTDGEEMVIFTGPLSEYDNGAWAGMDFTEARFAMIFDWDTDDTYYIIPLDISNDMSDIMGITGENAAIQPSDLVDGIEASANILYNGAYYENILYKDAQLSAEAIVKNTSGSTKDISIIVALYDENGKLKNVSSNPAEIINGSSQTLSAAISIPNLDGCYAKVFVWDSESLKPYTNSLTLSTAKKRSFWELV